MHKDTGWPDFWPGFLVVDQRREGQDIEIELQGSEEAELRCGRCPRPSARIHAYVWRPVRDLPMLGYTVRLRVRLCRLVCEDCGQCMQLVPWLSRYARLTQRLEQAVAQLHAHEQQACGAALWAALGHSAGD